jgi:hypothetical protein
MVLLKINKYFITIYIYIYLSNSCNTAIYNLVNGYCVNKKHLIHSMKNLIFFYYFSVTKHAQHVLNIKNYNLIN